MQWQESRPEVNEDAAKRQSNGSADNRHSSSMKPNDSSQQRNPEFWGDLNEPSAEHIKLEPFLDRDDDNDNVRTDLYFKSLKDRAVYCEFRVNLSL